MSKQTVYIETSIVSYLAARPSRDLVRVAMQQMTHDWWDTRRGHFDVYVSEAVLEEAVRGDEHAAARRMALLDGLGVLDVTDEATAMADMMLQSGLVPPRAAIDALHMAVAAVHGMDFLLTWRRSGVAAISAVRTAAKFIESCGYTAPVVCSPYGLMGEGDVDPIVKEVRAARERLAAKFNYDVRAILEDARKRQRESGRKVVTLPPKRPAGQK